MRFLMFFFLSSTVFGWEHTDWLSQVENRMDEEAIAWLRKQINTEENNQPDLSSFLKDQCKTCFKGKILETETPRLFVFMSFSIPDTIWISLSKEMADHQAVFVLRGLPDNSFKSLAQKISQLKEKGMEASVQIYPHLFKEYAVERVPCFVFSDDGNVDKCAGTTSIAYASSLLKEKKIGGNESGG